MGHPPADDPPPTIYLMGMMGSGKSTLGRALARELHRPFVDLDGRIERRAGFDIPDIFERYGETYFRDLESATLAELSAERPSVVALGGGTTERAANRRMLRQHGCVVYLRARPATLAGRVADGADRPLLRDADDPQSTLQELLARREPGYEALADVAIDNEGDPNDTLRRLLDALSRGGWLDHGDDPG